jgi:uncharacterized protein (DUF1810 family)
MNTLDRFKEAQRGSRTGFEVALSELREGRKRSHWIWYVFPQLRGLGSSPMADHYGIADVGEAEAYLRDPELRGRLLTAASVALDQVRAGIPLDSLMGADIDTLKLVSSMTLFGAVARQVNDADAAGECARLGSVADELMNAAGTEGYGRCAFTQRHLAAAGYPER